MPYPNEHAARLRSPEDFSPDTFRRTSGGTIFGRVDVPKTIDIIWGKLKGADSADDFPVPQALRFPVKNWTADEAKAWLKKNEVTYISFEKASGAKEGEGMEEDGKLKTYPAEAFMLSEAETDLKVLLADEDEKPRRVRMVVNSGKVHGHHIWGRMVLDASRGTVGNPNKSILVEHDPLLIAGATDRMAIEESGRTTAEGYLTDKTDIGRERMALLSEGHPFEVSCFVLPKRVVRLSEGQTREVNGRQVEGPCHVFQDWKIREVSLCALGADERTSAVALSDKREAVQVLLLGEDIDHTNGKDKGMEETTTTTEDTQEETTDDTESTEEVEASENAEETEETTEGESTEDEVKESHPADVERARCSAIVKKANALGLYELGQACIDDGLTVDAAVIKLQDARLQQLQKGASVAPGANDGDEVTPADGKLSIEDQAKADWEKMDEGARTAFFRKYEFYLAYRQHQAELEND